MMEKTNVIRYEVPLTWLIGAAITVATSLFYAGWQAADLKIQLETVVRLGKELVARQEAMSNEIIDLKVKDQLKDSKISQIEQRLDRLEKK